MDFETDTGALIRILTEEAKDVYGVILTDDEYSLLKYVRELTWPELINDSEFHSSECECKICSTE